AMCFPVAYMANIACILRIGIQETSMILRDWAVAGVVLVLTAAPAVVVAASVQAREDKVACAGNLRTLWQCQCIYTVQYGGQNRLYPTELGGEFWLKLTRTPKAMIENLDVLLCPVTKDKADPNHTSFRGPNGNVNKFEDKDPI